MATSDATAPDVSVIVRSMARPTLDAALASAVSQHGVTAEVLVVAACGPAHPPLPPTCGPHVLRLVTGTGRLPRAAAANAGLDAARGRWITFLDDDDVFLPDHLAGLLAAAAQDPEVRVVTSYAKSVFRDGHVEWFGQPFSLTQLYERNFIHLSSTLFARELVLAGCRFDEDLEILEDWEFMLQLAQRARFRFVPLGSFQWHADAGDSGAAGGANHDPAKFARHRERIYARWAPARDALVERTAPLLERAAGLAQSGHLAGGRRAVPRGARDQRERSLGAAAPRDAPAPGGAARRRPRRADACRRRCGRRTPRSSTIWPCSTANAATSTPRAATPRRAAALDPAFAPARALLAELG